MTFFLINDSLVFEIGGAGKTMKQISGLSKAYLALDNIEIGDPDDLIDLSVSDWNEADKL